MMDRGQPSDVAGSSAARQIRHFLMLRHSVSNTLCSRFLSIVLD